MTISWVARLFIFVPNEVRFLSAIATVSMDTLHLDTRSHPVLNVLLWAAPPPPLPLVCHSLINSELFAFVSTLQKNRLKFATELTASARVYISSAGQFSAMDQHKSTTWCTAHFFQIINFCRGETSTGALIIWNAHTHIFQEYLSDVCTIVRRWWVRHWSGLSPWAGEEAVAVQDPGSWAQIIRGALCGWVGGSHRCWVAAAVSFPATKWDSQSIGRQSNFWRKPQRWEHTRTQTHTQTHKHTYTENIKSTTPQESEPRRGEVIF